MKVLISDNISIKGIEILKNAGLQVDVKVGLKPEELKDLIKDYNAIVIRSATKLTADIIEQAKNLKVIGRAGSGLDNVDRVAATKHGIVVMNTPGGNTITTAEHTIAMLFAIARKIPQANASMTAGKWEKKRFIGVELYNKTLGIIGLGRIGTEVARRCQGLGMNILAYDPFISDEKAIELGIEKVELDELFRKADFITIHTPLTAETKNIINKKTINKMKDGVYIINCARGGIINEGDLLEALNSGKVAGAALDVFEKEPPENNPLVGHERVICTPHLGASTKEAQENVAIAVAEQIRDYLLHGTIRHAVNFPSIPADQLSTLKPYISLAENMGSFASQMFEEGIKELHLEYRGEAANLTTSPLTAAALKGLLTPILHESVNFINSPMIAKERGIEVKETKSQDAGDYYSMVVMTLKSARRSFTIAGTLFSKKDPRIVKVNHFTVEITPEGNMLFLYNNDKPGVIGNIGTLLGKNGINIGRMHFGRETPGGLAISVVNVDSPVDDRIIEELKALPNIIDVKRLYF
ncbi:MAG: phosphoglycerate dehydrogenase [Thermodesulfovibrionales bacterium]|nr:phosphoglycerate dehydrogenase [Thermodesulfovibrionales bacterium]